MCAGPVVLSLALGLWGIDRGHSMWRDEAVTWQVSHRPLAEIGQLVQGVDIVHALYYALMHGVFAFFGDSLMTLRLPSVLATAAACGLIALVGARLAGRPAGIGAGLALAMVPAVQEHAQEGRSYALVLAFVALSTLLLVNALERPEARRWTAYGAATLIAALLNWFSLLALVAHAVTVMWLRPGRARVTGWSCAVAVAVAGALPLVLLSRAQAGQVAWIDPPDRTTVAGVVITVTIAVLCARMPLARIPLARTSLARMQLARMQLARVPLVPVPLVRRPEPVRGADRLVRGDEPAVREDGPPVPLSLAAVALPLCAVPQIVLLVVSFVKPLYLTRYVLFAYEGLALLIGVLVATAAVRVRADVRIVLPAAVALTLLALLPTELRLRSPQSRVDDVLTAAAAVASRDGADGVLFIPAARRDTALVSPHAFTGLRDLALAEDRLESGTMQGTEAAPDAIEREVKGARRIVLVTDPGPGRPRSVRDRAKRNALDQHFVRRSTQIERGRRISLYERRPGSGAGGP